MFAFLSPGAWLWYSVLMTKIWLLIFLGCAGCEGARSAPSDSVRVGEVEPLEFAVIGDWDYERLGVEGLPAKVRDLSGRRVQMKGRLFPVDDIVSRSLMLYEDRDEVGAGEPGLHEAVKVSFLTPVDSSIPRPVTIVGVFSVRPVIKDGYCVEIFHLAAETIVFAK